MTQEELMMLLAQLCYQIREEYEPAVPITLTMAARDVARCEAVITEMGKRSRKRLEDMLSTLEARMVQLDPNVAKA